MIIKTTKRFFVKFRICFITLTGKLTLKSSILTLDYKYILSPRSTELRLYRYNPRNLYRFRIHITYFILITKKTHDNSFKIFSEIVA